MGFASYSPPPVAPASAMCDWIPSTRATSIWYSATDSAGPRKALVRAVGSGKPGHKPDARAPSLAGRACVMLPGSALHAVLPVHARRVRPQLLKAVVRPRVAVEHVNDHVAVVLHHPA